METTKLYVEYIVVGMETLAVYLFGYIYYYRRRIFTNY